MGRPVKDFTGQKFGMLTAVRNSGRKIGNAFVWEWRCDCGSHHEALPSHVRSGSTISCGCYRDSKSLAAGQRYGRLVSVEIVGRNRHQHRIWKWKCDCGNYHLSPDYPVKQGRVVSCGCYHREQSRARSVTHDQHKTRTYRAWIALKARVGGKDDVSIEHYVNRGITVSPEWASDFPAFLADMGECPAGMSIERINNDGNYEAGNCRWATQREQLANTRRTIRIQFKGQERCLKHACQESGIGYSCVRSRIRRGYDAQQAFDMG